VALALNYFASDAGRSQAIEFLNALAATPRAQIVADVEVYRLYMHKAPISCKPIRGSRPMFEIRTGAFRTYCVVRTQALWVLHVGRKQDQRRDIRVAAARMKVVLGG
jgi:hypothetical protein